MNGLHLILMQNIILYSEEERPNVQYVSVQTSTLA